MFDRYRLVVEWSFICLAVFLACSASSARSSNKPVRIAVAYPGARPPRAAGPARPAGPVTFLLNSRSRTCKKNTVQIFTHWGKALALLWMLGLTSHVSTVNLTSGSCFVAFEVLAAQAFEQVSTHADTLSVQQGESAAVMTWLTLAQVILCHVVCCGLPQVRDPGVSVLHVQWN